MRIEAVQIVMRLLRTLAILAVMAGATVALDFGPLSYSPVVQAFGDCRMDCKTNRARCERRTCRQGSARYTGTLMRRGRCCFRDCPESPWNNRCIDHSYKVGCCGTRTS